MGVLNSNSKEFAPYRADSSVTKGNPRCKTREELKRRTKLGSWFVAVALVVACLLTLWTPVFAAPSMTARENITENGFYTVIAIDEAGNKTIETVTIDNVVPKQEEDEEGNILPDDELPDQDYTEEIIATLTNETVVKENGVYTVFVVDKSGNLIKQTVTVSNIEDDGIGDGEDEGGNIVPDENIPEIPDEDYTEDILEQMSGTGTVTSNGTYTAWVKDAAGNMVKKTYVITNVIDQSVINPDKPIEPDPDVPETDEDYTEEIPEKLSGSTTVTTNGHYTAAVYDQSGNATFVDIIVENVIEPEEEDPDAPDTPDEIIPDDVPGTEDDPVEEITGELTDTLTILESGIYAAVGKDQAGLLGITSVEVTIVEAEEPEEPTLDTIEPDTPGSEEPSPDGNVITDTITVYENGIYAASGLDNVECIGVESIVVKNIGAPEIEILKNPATLVRKTNDDGTSYGEATIIFTVNIPDGALVESVMVVNETGEAQPVTLQRGKYTTTITKNGQYYILAVDVTGRDAEYPLMVDYIYELEPDTTVYAKQGEDAEISANVVGGYPEKLQWYSCNAMGMDAKPIEGATKETLIVPSVSNEHNNTYYFCVATTGKYVVTSQPIQLVVYAPPVMESSGYTYACEDMEFTLSIGKSEEDDIRIVVDGNPTEYTYQWYYATSAKGERIPIEGAKNASYTTTATAKMDGYYYFVEVTAGPCSAMSDSLYLSVYGKPTPPVFTMSLMDGTVIPEGGWAVSAPVLLTMGGSTADGTVGYIDYEYSYDGIRWYKMENALMFTESTEGTVVYGRATNVAMAAVISDTSEYTVQIQLEDPKIHDSHEDVVPGIRYNKAEWVNEPKHIQLYANTLSGIKDLKVYFLAEGETVWTELVDDKGKPIYRLDEEIVDGTHFTNHRVDKGIWYATFGAAENGMYQVAFRDASGRPLDGSYISTQAFEVAGIDYGAPTITSITVDRPNKATEKTITVADVYDEYSASKYGYSGMYGYYYSKDAEAAPAKGDESWIRFTDENSTYVTDDKGNKHYTFDIKLEGRDANGTYNIWVIDAAGNVTTEVLEVSGIVDKMKDIKFDVDELDLTTPTEGLVEISYSGEASHVIAVSSDTSVATTSVRFKQEDKNNGCYVVVNPVDLGTATIDIALVDYNDVEYTHTVEVSVKNMVPKVSVEPPDTPVAPGGNADIVFTAEGTNLSYQWYYGNEPGTNGVAISGDNPNFAVTVKSESVSKHEVTLTVKNCTKSMDGSYYWCEFVTTEGTPEYTATTKAAKLLVAGDVSAPTIAATSNGKPVVSNQWTSKDIEFTLSGSVVTEGSGFPGYQYRVDGESEWKAVAGDSFTYIAKNYPDSANRKLFVRAVNAILPEIVSEEVTYIIKQDTVVPSITVTGNPTAWTTTPPTLTASMSDIASGISNETVDIYITDANGATVASGSEPVVANRTFNFTVPHNGQLTIHAHDVAGNDAAYKLNVTFVDVNRPKLTVEETPADDGFLTVTLVGSDTHGIIEESKAKDLVYSFDGGVTWSKSNVQVIQIGTVMNLGVKDVAGNISLRMQKIGGGAVGGGAGGGYAQPELIDVFELSIEDYQLGKDFYIDANGEKKAYETHPESGLPCLPVEISAVTANGGFLYGYAQVNGSNTKFPILWDGKTVSDNGENGLFYIMPNTLLQSARNARITVYVAEFEDEELTKKTCSDSISAMVTVDVSPPVINLSMGVTTRQVTITARDVLSGLESVRYSIETASGATPFAEYTDPFVAPNDCTTILVEATDKLGNTCTYSQSVSQEGMGSSAGAYPGAYFYKTSIFNYWLIGSTEKATSAETETPPAEEVGP